MIAACVLAAALQVTSGTVTYTGDVPVYDMYGANFEARGPGADLGNVSDTLDAWLGGSTLPGDIVYAGVAYEVAGLDRGGQFTFDAQAFTPASVVDVAFAFVGYMMLPDAARTRVELFGHGVADAAFRAEVLPTGATHWWLERVTYEFTTPEPRSVLLVVGGALLFVGRGLVKHGGPA